MPQAEPPLAIITSRIHFDRSVGGVELEFTFRSDASGEPKWVVSEGEFDFLFAGQGNEPEIIKTAAECLLTVYLSIKAMHVGEKVLQTLLNEVVKEVVNWVKKQMHHDKRTTRVELFGPDGNVIRILEIEQDGTVEKTVKALSRTLPKKTK